MEMGNSQTKKRAIHIDPEPEREEVAIFHSNKQKVKLDFKNGDLRQSSRLRFSGGLQRSAYKLK